jgi:hypothetical protein
MELGAIFEYIQQLPKQAQTALLRELKLTDARNMPAGAVLVAMQLLTALGVLRQIDLALGEEHTSLEYLKKEMAAGRKQIPSSGILICLLVADMLACCRYACLLPICLLTRNKSPVSTKCRLWPKHGIRTNYLALTRIF